MALMTFRRPYYRLYFLILCSFYLLVVFLFHGQLQIEIINRNQQIQSPLRNLNVRNDVLTENKRILLPPMGNHSCFLSSNTKYFTYSVVEKSVMYLYSAYFDKRSEKPMVRIMSILLRVKKKKVTVFCKFDGGKIVQNGTMYEMCENHNRRFGGHIISCEVPKSIKKPCIITVKVIDKYENDDVIGEVTLPVIDISPEAAEFNYGICVPPLFGKVLKESLVEFIELSKLLGASHFIFYDFNIANEESRKVLSLYEKQGIVTVIPWQLPYDMKDTDIWYHGQLVAHNDCLYRSMSLLKFVSVQDIDEFIVPHNGHVSWSSAFQHFFKDDVAGLSFHSVFFDPQLSGHSSQLVTIDSTMRTKLYSRIRTKVMVQPSKIFEIGIHHVSRPLEEQFKVLTVDVGVAHLHHYRKCVANYGMKCVEYIEDRTVHLYYNDLKRNFDLVMKIVSES